MTAEPLAVLDTNILAGALFPRRSAPRRVLEAFLAGEFRIALTQPVFDEMRLILGKMRAARPRLPDGMNVDDLLALMKERAAWVDPITIDSPLCEDPDDDKLFACAAAARADYLVSNDTLVLDVVEFEGVRVIRAGEFLKRLG
ncbi:MAG: putative toxin-antitoxin system toxin component, PIN family [Deltaproteobacteria bacterium]|nr:putative toxin-antitoxin system toxin component, PIN family [Deltaproteobacteria bacterium]